MVSVLGLFILNAFALGPVQWGPVNHDNLAQTAVLTSDDLAQAQIMQVNEVDRYQGAMENTGEVRGIIIGDRHIQYWSKYFDNIILVNKSTEVQRVQVYRFGQIVPEQTILRKNKQGQMQEEERWKVSTGTERWSCEVVKNPQGQIIAVEPVWTGTPTGFYVSTYGDVDHHSNAFDDASMRWAFFFNRGIATHKGMEPHKFGLQRASHGCVRMTEEDARDIFKWTMLSGGPVNLSDARFKGQCASPQRKSGDELEKGISAAAARTPYFQKEIASALAEGQAKGLPYEKLQQIPKVTVSGNWNGTTYQDGYKTLVIVQCVNRDGSDCSMAQKPMQPACDRSVVPEQQEVRQQQSTDPITSFFNSLGRLGQPAPRPAPLPRAEVQEAPRPRASIPAPAKSKSQGGWPGGGFDD